MENKTKLLLVEDNLGYLIPAKEELRRRFPSYEIQCRQTFDEGNTYVENNDDISIAIIDLKLRKNDDESIPMSKAGWTIIHNIREKNKEAMIIVWSIANKDKFKELIKSYDTYFVEKYSLGNAGAMQLVNCILNNFKPNKK